MDMCLICGLEVGIKNSQFELSILGFRVGRSFDREIEGQDEFVWGIWLKGFDPGVSNCISMV